MYIFTTELNDKNNMKKIITYYRVSTKKQGLGLDAQKSAVDAYVMAHPCEVVGVFQEKESGKISDRIELLKALELCKAYNATLVIAKLDRLSRDVEFIFKLKNSGVNFLALDIPDCNTLTLGIFAVIAQHERELISQRTKAALNELKKQGKKLGTPRNLINNLDKAIENANKTKTANALNNPNNKRAYAIIKSLREQNINWSKIAVYLNENGFITSRGKQFKMQSVKNTFELFQANQI